MRVLNKSTLLGTTLVAISILNFSVLDQVGVGLVDSVHATFEDLGAEWIGLHVVGPNLDAEGLRAELTEIPGVRSGLVYSSISVFTFGSASVASPAPGRVIVGGAATTEFVLTSETYDLDQHPFLFVFREETETKAKFYRDLILWIDGQPPGPGQVALSTDTAQEAGLIVGDTFTQVFGATPFNPVGTYQANFTVSGIYQRAYTDPGGDPPEIVILGPNPELQAAPVAIRDVVIVQASLPVILRVVDDATQRLEAQGNVVSTEPFQAGTRQRTGGGGGFFGGGGGFQGAGPGGTAPDLILFANGDVLASALDAAERAGLWFRTLTTGAVILAVLGIVFVTAAMERKVRRDVGIRQAVGYPLRRIWLHWATVATLMGLTGAAVGLLLVYAISTLGLSQALLGIDVAFRTSTGVLLAPAASVLVYALATLPTYAKVLRSSPAQNLRVLTE